MTPLTSTAIEVLLAATPEALLLLDSGGRVLAANEAAGALFEMTPAALSGLHHGALIPEGFTEGRPDQPRARRYAQRPGGAAFPTEISVRNFSEGGERYTAVVLRDASYQEAMEARLHERERQLERAARVAHLCMWRWDHVAWRFELSPELCALLGLPVERACPTLDEALPFLHPDERMALIDRMREHFASGRPFAFDLRLTITGGGVVPVHCDGELDLDAAGLPLGVFGVIQRVTGHELLSLQRRYHDLEAEMAERHLVEQALRAERDRAQSYLDVAGVMFIGLDGHGRVQLANAKAAEILGCRIDEVIGRDWFSHFVPEAHSETVRQVFGSIMRGEIEPNSHYENGVRRVDGSERLIAWHNVVLRDDLGRITGTLSSGEDITERRNAELSLQRSVQEVQAVNRELESFAYTVSHDLRTPLRSIQGFSQLLLSDHQHALDPEAERLLHRIAQNAERLNELTEHLLALSRVGRATLQVQPVDLATIAREVVEMLQDAPGATRVEWVIPESLPARADNALIRALLQNLCDNARKFAHPAPSPRVEVGREADGSYFVRDNGVGFDMAFADKLFRPFQRLHDRSFEGTGVGLATVARVVERHGGRVWAESTPGAGACFRFTLSD